MLELKMAPHNSVDVIANNPYVVVWRASGEFSVKSLYGLCDLSISSTDLNVDVVWYKVIPLKVMFCIAFVVG